jgi:uncharacterized protein
MPAAPAATYLPAIPTSLQQCAATSAADWAAVLAAAPQQAARWMQAAATLGHSGAQATLGQWLLDGHGLERNPAEALAWFIKAARLGHPMGMNMAGRCCEMGWGTRQNFETAANWYRQAAHKDLPAAMYNFANLLAAGKGLAQDHANALAWYKQAADLGYAKAMTKIGKYYEDGLLVEKDLEAAFFCYREGAEGGDFRGQFCYAGMLAARGNTAEALLWLRKVPLTATPAYMQEAGQLLSQSPHPEFRQIGEQMLQARSEK